MATKFEDAVCYIYSSTAWQVYSGEVWAGVYWSSVYGGRDVSLCLPTGFSKSISYQVLPLLFDHKRSLIGSGSGSKRSCGIVHGVPSHCSDGEPGQESEARWDASCQSLQGLETMCPAKEIMATIASMESTSFCTMLHLSVVWFYVVINLLLETGPVH